MLRPYSYDVPQKRCCAEQGEACLAPTDSVAFVESAADVLS